MDVSLTSAVVRTATQLASARTADALNTLVLRKALDMQERSASQLLQTLTAPTAGAGLARSGSLGTQVNTWA